MLLALLSLLPAIVAVVLFLAVVEMQPPSGPARAKLPRARVHRRARSGE